jgi:hypothetical protein
MKRILPVLFLVGLGTVGSLYWLHSIGAEERRAFVPFRHMAEARAFAIRQHHDAIRKHLEAVRSVAWRQVFDRQKEEMARQHNLGSPILAYCENMLASSKSDQLPTDFADKIDKLYVDLYGRPDEATLIAIKACAEVAMRDAETVVDLSESFEKRP